MKLFQKAFLFPLAAVVLSSCDLAGLLSSATATSSDTPSSEVATSVATTSEEEATSEVTSEATSEIEETSIVSEQSSEEATSELPSSQTSVGPVETSSEASSEETPLEKTKIACTYNDYMANCIYPLDNCPTLGHSKLLVIPVWFSDSTDFILSSKKETIRADIEKAYFGSEEETGWHSVSSFYKEESKGKLQLSGTVSSWYNVDGSYKDYGPNNSGGSKTEELVTKATDDYFKNHVDEKRTDYDSDGNGFLDGVMLIYAAPNYASLNKSSYKNLWAYCYWLQDDEAMDVDNPNPNVFFWASYDFMYSSSLAKTKTGKSSYGYGNTSHCSVDAHTYIHEMGHVFGLDDYYDYGENYYSPAGGFSMQDENIGGHDPFSVMAMGWADPYIPTESCKITISDFQSTHDMILLTPQWNSFDSPFDEYLLLELYTPTGLNEFDTKYKYAGTQGPNAVGLRLWHVDARLAYFNKEDPDPKAITTNPNYNCRNGVYQAFSNTYGDEDYGSILGSSYWNYNLLQLIHQDGIGCDAPGGRTIDSNSLFKNGSSFSMSGNKYKNQFANSGKLDSSKNLGWSFSATISGTGSSSKATVTLTRS